ncbi:MAG: high-affinity [Beijerinckiaceae bacterium]|nr:MAG: high-affinity [Beijerinckiaceae bacterium]
MKMRNSALRASLVTLLITGVPVLALAQANPFGTRVPGGSAPVPVSGITGWLLQQQAAFHKALTAAISAVETSPSALWGLVGLAFAYGALHAVGPGHGKAVIASYLVANERALKRGIGLAFGAALVQALIAIGVVGIVAGLMSGTAAMMNRTVELVEQGGFLIIVAMGLWIAFRKARALFSPASAASCEPDCGHDHGGDPAMLARASTRELVLTAIGAGIRPCSGAIILLVFALTKGLFLAGALSVGAMAVGTAIGTSAFAFIAVKAKVIALNMISGGTGVLRRLGLVIELLAGLLLAALGVALLLGAMSAGS